MRQRYDHRLIEPKWQDYWARKRLFEAHEDPSRPKYYVLDMFPYPSGAGLHVGHVVGYTATDIVARYKRQRGFNVLHPMGWDSFGLPAEQYAVRTGTHPAITTQTNIETYRRQLQAIGISYAWDREVATSDPEYYKWTQWIFTQLFHKGLAYQADILVNYCPELGTVLANEEVENGKSVEGGHPVVRRPLRQWVFKIREYADRLLSGLEGLDWPEHLKQAQRNWIGRREGATIDFVEVNSHERISVFTTLPQTVFGATFLVLSPEHPLVDQVTTEAQHRDVETYKKQAAVKSDLERTELTSDKTGVWTGGYALNPATGQQVPIWVADYVLMGYGTGAVMGDAHDERDFEFAKKYRIPLLCVVDPDLGSVEELPEGVDDAEAYRRSIHACSHVWIGGGTMMNSANRDISLDGHTLEESKPLAIRWLEKTGMGKGVVNYRLRDWLFSRQRYWGEPFPVLHLEDGSVRCLELDELPLIPPALADYKPAGDGQSPLAKERGWVEIVDPRTGQRALRETNTMPQWAGSCWYYLRFCDAHNSNAAWDKAKEGYWMPVDLYMGGSEHICTHLLYSRFWHQVLWDLGLVSTPEPFQTYRTPGLVVSRAYQRESGSYVAPEDVVEREGSYFDRVTGEPLRSQIEKMSKSKLNGVSPDQMVEQYGADAMRLYGTFIGPIDREKVWNSDAVTGCSRFLNRFWEMATSDKVSDEATPEALRLGMRLVHQITHDIEQLSFNTAVAKMMEFLNDFTRLSAFPRQVVRWAIQVLYPFAPHMAQEAWQALGFTEELAFCPYPEIDRQLLEQGSVTYVIQINGKVRGRFELPKGQSEEQLLQLARQDANVARHMTGPVAKLVHVPDKLLNIVVGA
jgi:leucyl-tRNA synthetase